MKAIEYADKFFKDSIIIGENEAIKNLVFDLLREGQDIIKQRHAKKDSAIMSILREQNLKWKACCNIINRKQNFLKLDGYEQILKHEMGIEI
jgi:hypothetical protein